MYLCYGRGLTCRRCHEEVGGVDVEAVVSAEMGVVVGMDCYYFLNLVAPEYYPYDDVFVGQADIYRVAFDAEITSLEVNLIAAVERGDKFAQESIAADSHAFAHRNHILMEVFGIAHAVEARYRRNHYHIAPARE